MKLSKSTVQRLSKYRRLLKDYSYDKDAYIFSHDLARVLNLNPVQVRRDLMLIGSSGNNRKGYNINELLNYIKKAIDFEHGKNIAIIGYGKIGKAILKYIKDIESKVIIVAAFDIDPLKVNTNENDIYCYDIPKLYDIIREKNIQIALLTVPSDFAVSIADILVESGIKGILNFTGVHLDLPDNIYVKEFDIISFIEEIGYFINK
jgi:redox-sensing transcriptional repressor